MGRISALTELTSLASDDYLVVLDSSANIAKKITIANAFGIPDSNWTASGESWTYATSTTITVPTDATTKYDEGMLVKFTQATGGTKYAVITNVATTVLTLFMLGGATLVNEALTSTQYTALASPLGAGLINGKRLDFSFTGEGGIWWEELARTTLSSAADTITVNNIPVRKYLRIYTLVYAVSGVSDTNFRFNNDGAGTSYAYGHSASFAAPTTAVSSPNQPYESGQTDSGGIMFGFIEVVNISGEEKSYRFETVSQDAAGAATLPVLLSGWGKWANTSNSITRFDLVNSGAGDMGAGSEVVVMGHN